MKKLFENWRKVVNENRKIELDEKMPSSWDDIVPGDIGGTPEGDKERAKELAQDTAVAQDREENPQDAFGNIPSATEPPAPAPTPKPKKKVKGSSKMRKYINSLLKGGKIDKATWKKARRALYKGDDAASAVLKNNIKGAGGTPGKTTSDPKFVAHIAKQMGGAGSLTNQLKEPLKSKYQAKYVEMMKAADRSQPNYRQKILMTLNGQLAKTGTLEENNKSSLSHNMLVELVNEVITQDFNEGLADKFASAVDVFGQLDQDEKQDQGRARAEALPRAIAQDRAKNPQDEFGNIPSAKPSKPAPKPAPKRKIASGKMRQEINQMLKAGKIDKATWTKARRALYKSTDAAQAILDAAGKKNVGPAVAGAVNAPGGKPKVPESPALQEIKKTIRQVINEAKRSRR